MLEALANVANNKMSASLSSSISCKDQQQQQCNSLQYSKTNSAVIDSLISSSNLIANSNALQNNSASSNKMKLPISNGNKPDFDLIDNKFNELAKKILEELNQTQYSKEFFKTIDDIIKEPSNKGTSLLSNYASRRANYHKKYQQLLNRQQQQIVQQQQQLQLLSKDRSQTKASQTDQQPRSLPVDVSISLQQKQKSQQQLSARHKTNSDSKTFSPNNNDQVLVTKGHVYRVSNTSLNRSSEQNSQNSYPLSRSATAVESMQNNVKRQQTIPRTQSPNIVSSANQDSSENNNNNQYLYKRHKNYSAGSVLNSHSQRPSIENHNSYDDSDDDNDDDDYDEYPIPAANQSLVNYKNSRFNPISKSKTLSDTTNISEIEMLTKQQHGLRQQQQQQYLKPNQKQQQPQQRFVKSTVASNDNDIHQQQDQLSEPKSMVLTGRDIGSLYKPHMNYSTSVLGNHRLSDDDEIIIIPTQSPSLVSNSPDPDHANIDELSERFSISRTKSFWEKLSKGNHGKRPNQVSSVDNPSIRLIKQIAHSNNNSNHNYHRQTLQQQQQQQQQNQQYNINGNKIRGARLTGHPHTLDRMDSTGGSNSNYSCSSSSDENGVGSHSQQNPAISEQEMSRQNRLRQTR